MANISKLFAFEVYSVSAHLPRVIFRLRMRINDITESGFLKGRLSVEDAILPKNSITFFCGISEIEKEGERERDHFYTLPNDAPADREFQFVIVA